jgi:hypothetical protein
MRTKYETLDDYLEALDAIKEKVAEQTQGMPPEQVQAYFARAARALQEATGERVRVRRGIRKASTAKR